MSSAPHCVSNVVDRVIFMDDFFGTNSGHHVVFKGDFTGTNIGNHCEFLGNFSGKNLGQSCVFFKNTPPSYTKKWREEEEEQGPANIEKDYYIGLPENKKKKQLSHQDLDHLYEDCYSNQTE